MNQPEPVEHGGQRILTTEQLAELYGTTAKRINDNFKSNQEKFVEGVHFFKLEGQELADFKNLPGISGLVGKNARQLMLWTRRGAARHSKMLGTDQAWDMFDSLEENYFNPQPRLPQTPEEMLALTMQVADNTTKRVKKVETRVTDLEDNTPLSASDYGYLTSQINKTVYGYIHGHHMELDNKQSGMFFKDLGHGLKSYTGVKYRSQLRRKDFDKACEFIDNWIPGTATLLQVKEMGADDA